jgi:hypothetical protein
LTPVLTPSARRGSLALQCLVPVVYAFAIWLLDSNGGTALLGRMFADLFVP